MYTIHVIVNLAFRLFLIYRHQPFQSPTTLNMGVDQEKLTLVTMGTYAKCNLPDDYTIVPAVVLKKAYLICTKQST